MIYVIRPIDYKRITSFTYIVDSNKMNWRYDKIGDDVYVQFLGEGQFVSSILTVKTKYNEALLMTNTKSFYFPKTNTFFREQLRTRLQGWTDDIWEWFEELLTDRFNQTI